MSRPTKAQCIIRGLQLFEGYPGVGDVYAEHDVILAGPKDALSVSAADQADLDKLGWFISKEFDCWAIFV